MPLFDPKSVHLLANPGAGSAMSVADLAEILPGATCREIGGDIGESVRRCIAAGATVVGVAGGDGSLRAAATELIDSDVVLLPIPGGTKNHFARDFNIEDLDAVAEALRTGVVSHIDVGRIGDEFFLNNATIGWYADLVRERTDLEPKVGRRAARIVSVVRNAARMPSMTVESFAPNPHRDRCWMVWIGNNVFGIDPSTLAERERHDEGLLDVRILVDQGRFSKARAALHLLRGSIETSDHLRRETTPRMTLELGGRDHIDVTLDGEVARLALPLDVRVQRRALQVLRPATAPA